MKKYLLIILLLSVTNTFSQNSGWSEPKQISTDGGASYIDFTIDNNNVIHCVWREYYDRWFRKIFYSKSEDMGETWSEPFDLSMNTGHWADHPKICSDSKNNIYVIYAYLIGEVPPSQLIFKKFDGEKWSDPVDIAEDSPNSEYPCLTIDNIDRVYAFWHNNYSKIYYRYLEDTVWSQIFKPFDDNYDFYIRKAMPDKNNNIHCVGQYKKDSEERYGLRPVYFTYDINNDLWKINKALSDTTSLLPIDIDLDSQNMPHIVWSQFAGEMMGGPIEGSFYSFYDGGSWSDPLQLDTVDAFNENPAIALDMDNDPHIMVRKYYHYESPKYTTLNYYNKLDNYERIDSLEFLGGHIIKYKDSTHYMIYSRVLEDDNSYSFFRKRSLSITSIEFNEDKKQGFRLFQNYPNPFNNSTIVQYNLKKQNKVEISIYDIKGSKVKTLVNEFKQAGNYYANWDATSNKGQKVGSGVYLYKITAGKYMAVKKMVLLQ